MFNTHTHTHTHTLSLSLSLPALSISLSQDITGCLNILRRAYCIMTKNAVPASLRRPIGPYPKPKVAGSAATRKRESKTAARKAARQSQKEKGAAGSRHQSRVDEQAEPDL
jgi:hypothetical protein